MAWTTPRTWVASEVVTDTMLNEQIRDNEAYLKSKADDYDAHKAASAAVHGLGTGVYVVGCKQGQRRIEAKVGSNSSGYSITVSWDNAFTTIYAVTMWGYQPSWDWTPNRNCNYSTTGATGDGDTDNSGATKYCHFLAVGI